jgi:hypothetical protein
MAEEWMTIRPHQPCQMTSLGAADDRELNSLVVGAQEAGDYVRGSDRVFARVTRTFRAIITIAPVAHGSGMRTLLTDSRANPLWP